MKTTNPNDRLTGRDIRRALNDFGLFSVILIIAFTAICILIAKC
jgi:hypothetical protein